MADYNRNQRGSHRISNHDWNEDRGRSRYEDDDNRYSGYESRYGNDFDEENAGWQSRYQREQDRSDYGRGNLYGSGRYGRHYESEFNTGNFGNERGSGYDRDRGYGSSYYGGGMGSSYDNDRGNSYRDRNLYDRDYQGMGRSGYSGTRLGGSNYGNYGDGNRSYYEGRNEGRGYGGYRSGHGNYYGSPGERDAERSWWDRTTDEVSSWFGDEDAERRRERDRVRAEYRGKGPKNYKRSDERIKDDINDRLSDDPFIDASDIEVNVMEGDVTLTGTVDERSAKRRAEDLADNVSGVKNVENRIKVSQRSNVMSGGVQNETTSMAKGSQSTSAVPGSERSKSKSYVTG